MLLPNVFKNNYIIYILVIAIILTKNIYILVILVNTVLILIYFYRSPVIKQQVYKNNCVYSPAYGTIHHIIKTSKYTYILIYLSMFDIHRQFYPINGVLVHRYYDNNGRFNLAYEFEKSSKNEKVVSIIRNTYGQLIKVTQIAGKFVRRITSDSKKIGDKVYIGHEMGFIHFGSRVDIQLPLNYDIKVNVGDYVNGPDTLIAC